MLCTPGSYNCKYYCSYLLGEELLNDIHTQRALVPFLTFGNTLAFASVLSSFHKLYFRDIFTKQSHQAIQFRIVNFSGADTTKDHLEAILRFIDGQFLKTQVHLASLPSSSVSVPIHWPP